MQISDWIAFGALIISLIALWVSWLGYQRDRSRISLKIEERNSPMSPQLLLKVINSGRRPAIITRVFARTSKGEDVPVTETQRMVNESESVEYHIPTGSLRGIITSITVEDTLGKKHKKNTSISYRFGKRTK